MKRVCVIVFGIFLCCNAYAQDTVAIKRLVAKLAIPLNTGGSERGTGFIVASRKDTLFIATAGHVLRDRDQSKPIIVTLGTDQDTLHATLQLLYDREKGDVYDLAICTVRLNGYTFPDIKSLDSLNVGVPVFYYRNLSMTANFGDPDQLLITRNEDIHTYQINMEEVSGGDSGGPVFTRWLEPYITGMILNGDQSCEVMQIGRILEIIKKEFKNLSIAIN